MDANAGSDGSKKSLPTQRKREEDERSNSGCPYIDDDVTDFEDLEKKLGEVHRLRKNLDNFRAFLTAMKDLKDVVQASGSGESDLLSTVDHLKGLLKITDKKEMSEFDSSALYRKHCELIEKVSQLDDMVNRVEKVLSRKDVRSLAKLLEDCEKNMLGLKVGLKEFQYIRAMDKEIGGLCRRYAKMFRVNERLSYKNDQLLDILEGKSNNRNKRERKRSYSW